MLIHNTRADFITLHESKLTPKAKTPKVHNFTTVRTDRLHKLGGGLSTLIRGNITFTTTDIPSTINTHNIELQMVMVHINNTKHITIANIYIPPRDSTSTHYKPIDTDIRFQRQQPTSGGTVRSSDLQIVVVVVVVIDLPLLRVAVEGSDNPVSLEKPCQASLPPDQQGRHSLGRHPEVQYVA